VAIEANTEELRPRIAKKPLKKPLAPAKTPLRPNQAQQQVLYGRPTRKFPTEIRKNRLAPS